MVGESVIEVAAGGERVEIRVDRADLEMAVGGFASEAELGLEPRRETRGRSGPKFQTGSAGAFERAEHDLEKVSDVPGLLVPDFEVYEERPFEDEADDGVAARRHAPVEKLHDPVGRPGVRRKAPVERLLGAVRPPSGAGVKRVGEGVVAGGEGRAGSRVKKAAPEPPEKRRRADGPHPEARGLHGAVAERPLADDPGTLVGETEVEGDPGLPAEAAELLADVPEERPVPERARLRVGHDVHGGGAGKSASRAAVTRAAPAVESESPISVERNGRGSRIRIPVVLPLPDGEVGVDAECGPEEAVDRGAVTRLRGADEDSHRAAVYRSAGALFSRVISAVVVSYRSAPLTARAITLLREDAARAGELLEAVAVVNSQDPGEVRAVSDVADVTIDPGRNLGYAGGLNQGIAGARGDVLFLMNPDVAVLPGAVAALAENVRREPLVLAGPATFLDPDAAILIPPFEEPGPLDLARRRLMLEPAAARRVFARRLRRTVCAAAALNRRKTLQVSAIPGALMAVSRRTIDAVGPFDEGYRLYYEENDWQRRLRRAGGRLFQVGAARAIHPYGRTTGAEPRAAAWFEESERRYFTTHFGARGAAALEALAKAPACAWPELPVAACLAWEGPALGVALSPLRSFAVFAWAPLSREDRAFEAPESLRPLLTETPWHARAVADAAGRTLAEVTLRV